MIKKLLLPHQGHFIQSPFLFPEKRYHILVAGYGAGKTSSIALNVENQAQMLQGRRDREGHRPRLLLGGVTLAHLEKTTLAYIMQDLENSKTKHKHDSKNNILKIGDVDVILVALQSPGEIVGFDVWGANLDEVDDLGLSAGEDVTFEAVKSVNERTRQIIPGMRKPFITMGSTSQGQKGLYRLYTQYKKSGTGFVLIRGRTKDNWYLDDSYVKSMYDMYNERERQVYLEGHFLAISRTQVFGDFDWERNYLDYDMAKDLRDDEILYWGQDFNQGYHRGSVFVVRGNTIYCVKRYEFPEIRYGPEVLRHDFPRQKIFFIPDTTAKDDIAHFARELSRADIRIVSRSKNPIVEDSAFLVNKLLYTKRLILTRGARETAEALSLQQRDKNGQIQKGVGKSSPVHDTDSVRLVCFFIVCNRRNFADIKRVTIDRHLALMEDAPAMKELERGYIEITPSAL